MEREGWKRARESRWRERDGKELGRVDGERRSTGYPAIPNNFIVHISIMCNYQIQVKIKKL